MPLNDETRSGRCGQSAGTEASSCDTRLDPARTPDAIETRSFAIIDAEIEDKPFTGHAWEIARRLIHTSGDVSLLQDLRLPERAIAVGVRAIRAGAPIYTDTEMVRAGIPLRRLEAFSCSVSCMLAAPGLAQLAAQKGTTRARAGMQALADRLHGSIVAIGNAPTALLALLEHVDAGGPAPALVIGMPVGFVNAAESKELLIRNTLLPSLTLLGRRGGSPLAAATVNALAVIAGRSDTGAEA